ncbi:hypothetical protein JYT89_00475 [Flavobacteriaceae bacterium AH-315-B10]|nr:hypothetical protein [Flavobacteriaceae bacterium AH-315-B10]
MQYLKHIFLLLPFFAFAQQSIETTFINKTELKAESIIGVDNFETTYYINNNELFKTERGIVSSTYSNIQLGYITSANTFNPLKINLFYRVFNTAIILDNRLSEMFKIDFNTIQPFKDITHISTGNDNAIWLFNQNTQQLENYDFKTNTTRAQTLPIQGEILDLKSNYNFCWLLTKDYILTYNYVGSLLSKIKNTGFTKLVGVNGNLILQKENQLFYLDKETEIFRELQIPKLLINQFFVMGETLYIYDNKFLYKYRLKII